jgi:hypothetical protein
LDASVRSKVLCSEALSRIQENVKKKTQESSALRGWKVIAEHLSQPTSTVQRWANEGMPVRREGRSVIADPEELRRWLGRESHAPEAVTIARNEDLTAALRRGVSAVRRKKKAA